MESELTQYMIIFAGAVSLLMFVSFAIFVIAMLREMRLKAEEIALARSGFELNPVVIRHHLHYIAPINHAYLQEMPLGVGMEDTAITRLPRPLYVTDRSASDATNYQQRSAEVHAVKVEPARTLHAS